MRGTAWWPGLLTLACGSAGTSDESPPGPTPCPPVVEDGGGGVPDPPQGADLCPAGCNYQSQDGCLASQSCLPAAVAGAVEPRCAAAGVVEPGGSCTRLDECVRGALCVNGACRRLCCGGDWSACGAGEGCFRALSLRIDGRSVPSGAMLCFPVDGCDALDPRACDELPGHDCKIVDPRGVTACVAKSAGALGEACGGAAQCGRGLVCAGGRCRQLCRALECGSPGCPEGTRCVHLDRHPATVGECAPD